MTDKLPVEFDKELAAFYVINGTNQKLRRVHTRQVKIDDVVIRVGDEVGFGRAAEEPVLNENGRWSVVMEMFDSVDDRTSESPEKTAP